VGNDAADGARGASYDSNILLYALLMSLGLILGCTPSQRNVENGKIVFQSDRDGNYDLHIMNLDGSDQHNLTNSPKDSRIANNFGPVASPDGKQIAFESNRDGNHEIYIIDIDSGDQTNLTNNVADDNSPSWSPDGKYIAFLSDRDAILVDENQDLWTNDLYIVNSDGSNPRRITNDKNLYGGISWSPDGKRFALCLAHPNPDGVYFSFDIYIMTLSDSNLIRLTYDTSMHECSPKWSPDGKRIVYGVDGSKYSNIHLMNADGTNQIALSIDPSILDSDPSWSPDGKHIVFSSRRGGGSHLYVMNADGTNQIQITNGPGEETFPTWLPITTP
jgi:Tol biopolymer transport system component